MSIAVEDVNAALAKIKPNSDFEITLTEFRNLLEYLNKEKLSPCDVKRALKVGGVILRKYSIDVQVKGHVGFAGLIYMLSPLTLPQP